MITLNITSTYRELTEAIRLNVHGCFTCDFKRTSRCWKCTPEVVRNDLLEVLRFARECAKEKGIRLPSKRDKKGEIKSNGTTRLTIESLDLFDDYDE